MCSRLSLLSRLATSRSLVNEQRVPFTVGVLINDTQEGRAVVDDSPGNGVVFYRPLAR
jgi:hypothetical protein